MALSVSGHAHIKFYFTLFRSSSPYISVNLSVHETCTASMLHGCFALRRYVRNGTPPLQQTLRSTGYRSCGGLISYDVSLKTMKAL